MDATYRADLRELNELNFARFDAKLEQRLAELKAELRSEISEQSGGLFREFSQRFAQIDARVERLEGVLSTKATTTDVQAVKGDLLRHLYGTIIAAWGTLLAAIITLFSLATG